MNYKNDIRIDETALDVEWLGQAELAVKWGRLWSEAKDELDRADENVKVVRSELVLEINTDPEKYLGEGVRPTDAKVEAAYRVDERYKEAKERWLRAMKDFNDIDVVKNEISFTRKAALENMVQLHGQQYFAGPKIPRNLKNEVKARRESNKKINKLKF